MSARSHMRSPRARRRPRSPSVESSDTLLASDAGESTTETVGESGLRDETDADSLEGAEGNVGSEL